MQNEEIYNLNIKSFEDKIILNILEQSLPPKMFEINLNLEELLKISKKLLKNGGTLGLVHRPERLIDILFQMRKYNIEPKKIRLVYPKKNKKANILLVEGKKNGKKGLKILPPLYSHNEDGTYTEEIQKYFE